MRLYTVLVLAISAVSIGCNTAAPVAENKSTPVNVSNEKQQTQIAHSSENQTPPANGTTSKWKQSGDPIDTKEFDSAIAAAEVALKKKDDATTKKALAEAYYKRAVALTDARQYASALGDYRRTIKYDPSNSDAKNWIDQIIGIYKSMGRESPPEGEEPPPLTKSTDKKP